MDMTQDAVPVGEQSFQEPEQSFEEPSLAEAVTPADDAPELSSLVIPEKAAVSDKLVQRAANIVSMSVIKEEANDPVAVQKSVEIHQQFAAQKNKLDQESVKNVTVGSYNSSLDAMRREAPESMLPFLDKLRIDPEDPSGLYKAQQRSLTGDVNDKKAFQMQMDGELAEFGDGISIPSMWLSIGKAFVPGLSTAPSRKLAGSEFLIGGAKQVQLVDWWLRLDTGMQKALWPTLLQNARDEGASLETMQSLTMFSNPYAHGAVAGMVGIELLDSLAVLDVFAIGAKIVSAATIRAKPLNILAVENRPVAASTVNTVLDNPQLAKTVGVPVHDAAAAAHPVSNLVEFDQAGDLLSGITVESGLNKANMESAVAGIQDFQKNNLIRDALSTEEKDLIEKKGIASYIEHLKAGGSNVEQAFIVSKDETSFNIAARMDDGVLQTQTFGYELNQIDGAFQPTAASKLFTYVTSPLTHIKNAFSGGKPLVQTAMLNEAQGAELGHRLKTLGKFVTKGLSTAEEVTLNQILLKGDEFIDADGIAGKVYTLKDFRDGIPSAGGNLYGTTKLYERYEYARKLNQEVLQLQQHIGTQKYLASGYKGITIDGSIDLGIPLSKDAAVKRLAEVGDHPIYSEAEGLSRTFSEAKLKDSYDRGYVLVGNLQKGFSLESGSLSNLALVHRKSIGNLPHNIYHPVKGYVPRIRIKDNFWLVREEPRTLNGKLESSWNAVRSFELPRDRLAVLRGELERSAGGRHMLEEAGGDVEKAAAKYGIRTIRKGELTDSQSALITDKQIGGLFSGHRAQRTLYHGAEGNVTTRISAFEAFDRQLTYVADRYSMSDFRDQLKAKFLAAANKHNLLATPNDFESVLTVGEKSDLYRNLNTTRNWIRDLNRMPTAGERSIQGVVRDIGEYLGNMGGMPRGIPNALLSFSHQNPAAVVRAMAFHPMLGMFNPAQFLIQAHNFSVAFALEPTRVLTNFRKYLGIRSVMHVDQVTSPGAFSVAAKAAGMDVKAFTAAVSDIRTLGLESVIRTNPDYNKVATGGAMGFMGSVKNVVFNKGLVFFNEGEMFSRIYSFLVARHRAYGDLERVLTKDELRGLSKDIDNLTLNMKHANRASWGKGVPSVITQFKGVHAKFAEVMLGKDLTLGEKGRVLTGQFVLYGSLGLPFGTYLMESLKSVRPPLEADGSVVPDSWYESLLEGGMLNYLLGNEVDVAKRASLGGAGVTLIGEILTDPVAKLTPPATTVVLKGFEFGNAFVHSLLSAGTPDYAWGAADIAQVGRYLAAIPSGSNYFFRAVDMWEKNEIRSTRGELLFRDPTSLEILGTAMGYQTIRESDYYAARKEMSAKLQDEKDVLQEVTRFLTDSIKVGRLDTPQGLANVSMTLSVLTSGVSGTVQQRIYSTAYNRAVNDDPASAKLLTNLVQKMFDDPDHAEQYLSILRTYNRGIQK